MNKSANIQDIEKMSAKMPAKYLREICQHYLKFVLKVL